MQQTVNRGPRLFPKTLPSIQTSNYQSSLKNDLQAKLQQQLQHIENEIKEQQQKRSQSVSDLDSDQTKSDQTNDESTDMLNETPDSKLSEKFTRAKFTPNTSNNKSCFDRMSTSRSSATNLNTAISNSSQNTFHLRSSFNSHHSLNSTNHSSSNTIKNASVNGSSNSNSSTSASSNSSTSSNNSSIEYASFNIKPSQYKQTGIFLPINNNKSSQTNGTSTSNTTSTSKKHITTVRYLKEDLELLVQRLRNLQKQRQNSSNSLAHNLEQFVKSVEEFNDKASQQIGLISVIQNTSTSDLTLNSQETQFQLRQLQSGIKQTCAHLVANKQLADLQVESSKLDASLSQLSKTFNEFMHILDRLNNQNSLSILKN